MGDLNDKPPIDLERISIHHFNVGKKIIGTIYGNFQKKAGGSPYMNRPKTRIRIDM
jgi:hypothetical protein